MTKTNSLTPLSVDDCQIDGENQNEHTEIESSDEAILDSCEMVATENRNENTADEQNSMQMLSATEQFSGDDAQDMPIDSSFRMIRSQFAQNVINYTDQPVSHSLGKTDITIPLYTVKCGSLELPITLTYNSSGIKVNDIAGPVGLGWTLNAGGAIVRDVRGSKDLLDTGGKEYLGRLQKPHSEQIGNSTSILSVEGITSSAQDDVLKMADKSCEEDNAYDKFYYYHPKGSGSFYMTDTIPYFNEGAKDESWHSISESRKFCCNNDNISYSLKLTENIYDEFRDRWVSYITKLDTFKITTDTGEVYSYKIAGGGVRSKDNWSRCDDCSRFNKNKNNKETSEEDFGGVSWSNWCVNKIESVDGLNSIQLENTPIANFYKDVLFDSCEYSRPFTTQNSNYFIKTNNDSWHDRSNLTTTRCYNVVHSVKKITFNGNEIEFKYRTQIFKNPYENAYFKEDPNVISTKERRLHLSEIVVKNCDGKITKRITFDNYEGEDNLLRFKLHGIKFFDGDDKLYDEYKFTYYDNPSTTMSEYAQDKFGYYNGKNSNKDLHFVALYDYELSSVSSRVYSFEHAVTNTLKSIKRLSGAETVFVYEPNTHRDSLITSIGIRIKEIKTYDSGKPVQVRDFVYEKSGVTIDMSKIDYSSYLDRRMYHHHKTGEVTQHLYFYPFTILPGVAMEEANIYYGKVSEIVSDLTTGVKLKTVYEYDTSDWQYEYVDKVYKAPVKTMGEKWKYISSIPDSVNFYTEQLREWYKYIGEIKGYFKYKPIPFGNVSSITTYETINNGAFKICEKQEFKYVKYNKKSLLVENYVKCMATTIYKRTPYKCIKSTKPKDLYYTIINFDQKLPANCNKPDYSIDKPRLYWLYKPKRTYFDEDAKKVKLENSWIYENFMQSVPEDCHRFDIYEDVFIYKLIETKNYQYHGADFIERKTGYTYVVGGVLSGAGYYPQSITTTDDCGVSTTSYSYNDKFPGLCSIKTLKKGDGESIKTQVIYSNFRPQKIIKTVTSGGKTKTIYELRGECLDKFGNYSYFQETGKPDKVIIWGYKGMYPVAEIVNADHAKVLECITQSQIDSIGDATSMDDYIDLLNSLRQKLSEALVTTYTYIPLVGVSSITDPAGRVQLYRYDGAGRLAAVCDEDGNLLETNEYASKTM